MTSLNGKPGKTLIKLPLPLTRKRRVELARQQFSEIRHGKNKFELDEVAYLEHKLLKLISNHTDDPVEKCFEVFSLYKYSHLKASLRMRHSSGYFIRYIDILKVTLLLFKEPRGFELLNRLNDKAKIELITELFNYQRIVDAFNDRWRLKHSLISILEVLEIAEATDLVMVEDLTDKKDLKRFLKYSRTQLNTSKRDSLSIEFVNLANSLIQSMIDDSLMEDLYSITSKNSTYTNYFKKYSFTTLLLLRSIYSEELVTEVLNRIKDEAVGWNEQQIIRLVKNWEELKDYPLSWSLSMNEEA